MSEQHLLNEVSVRLICDGERKRHDALLDEQHYLKSGQLVGEQLRYVAECDGQWLALLSWSAGSYHGGTELLFAERRDDAGRPRAGIALCPGTGLP